MKIQYLSATQINIYCGCSKKYYYNYVQKLPKQSKLSLVSGECFHTCMESYNKALFNGEKEPDIKILFQNIFKPTLELKGIVDTPEEIDSEQETMLKLLDEFLISEWAGIAPIGLEGVPMSEFEFSVWCYDPYTKEKLDLTISGKIDNIITLGNNVYIIDYKTTGKMWGEFACKRSKQMTIYYYVLSQLYPELFQNYNINLCHLFFLKHKKPKIESIITERNHIQIDNLMEIILKVEKGIQEEIFVPADNNDCSWCDFKEICGGEGK